MKNYPKQGLATAATSVLFVSVPKSAIIKHINAQNTSREWNKLSIMVSRSRSFETGHGVPLLHEAIQAGSRHVAWRGEFTIEEPFIYIVVQFFHCTIGDSLFMNVGYDMSPKKRGWSR